MKVAQAKFAVSFATLEWTVNSVADPPAYSLITPVIKSINGDVAEFYSNFLKVFVYAEDHFRGLDSNSTCI